MAVSLALASCAGVPRTMTKGGSAPTRALGADSGIPPKADAWFAIVTPDGLMVAINHASVHVTLQMRGSDVRTRPDDAHLYLVDGQIIQFAVTSTEDWGRGAEGAALLEAHMVWESNYVAESLRAPIVPRRMAPCAALGKRPCLVWVVDQTPTLDSTAETRVTGNVYATTVVQDQVLIVSSPVLGAATDTQVSNHLLEILASLDVRSSPILPEVESRRIRGEP